MGGRGWGRGEWGIPRPMTTRTIAIIALVIAVLVLLALVF
jgi:hypothetical protein